MISRINVFPNGPDSRNSNYRKAFTGLELTGKITNVNIGDSYLLASKLSKENLLKSARSLTNPNLERFTIDELPRGIKFNYLIEIGFLPGVTDNIAHTAKETVIDLLHHNITLLNGLEVYTSKVFLISGHITEKDAEKIASSLYNPLIERAMILDFKQISKFGFPKKAPVVILKKSTPVINLSLDVSDEELVKIGKEGIIDDATKLRRGPLALDLASMTTIKSYFHNQKRNPTDIEIESLAQTWSEHCKHTIFANQIDDIKDGLYKTYIKRATNLIREKKGKKDFCVSVFHDNAGGIIFDKEYLVTHKVETHNSPSALDPFGGAITGIVGVNRDTIGFGLGAKPVANTYGFCLGDPYDKRKFFKDKNLTQEMLPPKKIMDGVIRGINVGGNCSGIPTLNGFVKFDDRYRAKPLVFAGTVGIIPRKNGKRLLHEKAARAGDYIVVVGGRVGLDGIHGATFSSVAMDSSSPATAVQIGDPITQKKLSDAIVKEARGLNLYSSITDNGAGGISCSVAEMAKECGGAKVDLEKVPLKYPGLRPWEIWISESQERMTLSVPKSKWKKFQALMIKRGVEATIIGEFTKSKSCVVKFKGKKIMDIDMEFLHNGLPKHHLRTLSVTELREDPKNLKNLSLTKILEEMLTSSNIGGFSYISEQYDHEVQASSVLKPLSGRGLINTDAQVFRPILTSKKGVVLTSALYPSYSDIDTYHMAACSLDTAVRNIICAGGKLSNIAILDNFCWCSSYDPIRLAQLVSAVKACFDCAVGYETPFISGKDSMFNDFKGYNEKGEKVEISIPPTLLISAISVMQNLSKSISPEFKNAGDLIYLLGETKDELGATEYYKLLATKEGSQNIGSNVPKVNIKKNIMTYSRLEKAIEGELVSSALSLSSGGLAVALAKACIGGMLGCSVEVQNITRDVNSMETKLFSESQGRILISVNPKNKQKFEKIIKEINYVKLGTISENGKILVNNKRKKIIETTVKNLHNKYHNFSNKMK